VVRVRRPWQLQLGQKLSDLLLDLVMHHPELLQGQILRGGNVPVLTATVLRGGSGGDAAPLLAV